MSSNKGKPKFRRSFFRARRQKRAGFFARLGARLDGWWKGLGRGGQPEAGKAHHRPQPPVPADILEDLKIAVPKSKRLYQGLTRAKAAPRPEEMEPEADVFGPAPEESDFDPAPAPAAPPVKRPTRVCPPPRPRDRKFEAAAPAEPERPARAHPLPPPRERQPKAAVPADPRRRARVCPPPESRERKSEAAVPAELERVFSPFDGEPTTIEASFQPSGLEYGGLSTKQDTAVEAPEERYAAAPGPDRIVARPGDRRLPRGSRSGRDEEFIDSLLVEATRFETEEAGSPPSQPPQSDRDATVSVAPHETPELASGASEPMIELPAAPLTAEPAREPEPFEARPAPRPSPARQERAAASADRPGRRRRGLWAGLAVLFISVAGAALGLWHYSRPAPPAAKVARIPIASLPQVAPLAPGFYELYALEREAAIRTEVTISQGSTLGKALEEIGLGTRQGAPAIIQCLADQGKVAIGKVPPGTVVRAFWADRGHSELKRLEYCPDSGSAPMVIMPRPEGGFWLYNLASAPMTLTAAREGTIPNGGSLWQTGSQAGLDSDEIAALSDILASEVDFLTDIKDGDHFQVLFSREYQDGRPLRKDKPVIDMVKLINRGRSIEYYRFVNSRDEVAYYNHEGRSSKKTFFVSPLQYKRISSNFSMARKHPIFKVVRPHQGVDYAAPAGTPISTVADGVVVFAGWNGGYGRLVTIKHSDTYTTMYAHMSKFASGLNKGSVVKQGDLIGYVGATGTATGPHLDFRLKKNGNFIDPIPELAKQEGKAIEMDQKEFLAVVELLRKRMAEQLAANGNEG